MEGDLVGADALDGDENLAEFGAHVASIHDDRRARVVIEAASWLGTRYHHMGRVKGAGVDCLTLLAEVYAAAGVVEPVDEIPFYRPDFMFHADLETYLEGLLQYGREVAAPQIGDVALFKRDDWRVFGHAGIVAGEFRPRPGCQSWIRGACPGWPWLIHAIPGRRHGCCPADATQGFLRGHAVKFISPFCDPLR